MSRSHFRGLFFPIILVLVGLFLASKLSAENQKPINRCHLTMGWIVWPPYQSENENGKLVGLQADLFRAINQQADCDVSYKMGTWSEIQRGIEQGKIDFMGDATITNERQQFAYFSKPYRPEILALYIKKSALAKYPKISLKELLKTDFRLAITKGNYYGEIVEKLKNNPNFRKHFIEFSHTHQSYRALINGGVDGLFDDPMVHSYTIRLLGFETVFVRHQVVVNDDTVSLMFSKKSCNPALVERYNKAIQSVKKTNFYQNHWDW